jgi:ABC-type Fe3+/spermidine/putrescine transport system ATPase subunit
MGVTSVKGIANIVDFRGVTKRFGNVTVIRDVTFSVPDLPDKGEFVSILGPSGCGKSTVLRLIAGLRPHYPATEGTVLVGGKPVAHPGPDRSMVFQDYTSFANRTVEDNVAPEGPGASGAIRRANGSQMAWTWRRQPQRAVGRHSRRSPGP